MQAIKHFMAGEQALSEAHSVYGQPGGAQRATALAAIAQAEFAAAQAAAAFGNPHRDPVLDAEPELPHADRVSVAGQHWGAPVAVPS